MFLLAAVACGGSNSSTTSPPPTPTPSPTTFALSGQVTDGTTSASISGATISIVDSVNAGKSTTTDGSGNYSFTGLQPAGFTVNVTANGYVSQSKSVTLTSNQTLLFPLTRVPTAPSTFTVNGTVTDGTSGGILPTIVVQITGGANAGKSATTDGSRNYNIGGVAPGTFTMSAAAVSYQTTTKQVTVSADTRVDFVLQRVAPTPPPTAPPPAPSCTAPPGPPGFLGGTSAFLSSGSVQLFWGAATGTVTSYAVIDTGSAATSYTLTGLKTSVDYYHVRVRAKNSCGVSGFSNEANPRIA